MRGLIALAVVLFAFAAAVVICALIPGALSVIGFVSVTSMLALICIAADEWVRGIPLIEDDDESI